MRTSAILPDGRAAVLVPALFASDAAAGGASLGRILRRGPSTWEIVATTEELGSLEVEAALLADSTPAESGASSSLIASARRALDRLRPLVEAAPPTKQTLAAISSAADRVARISPHLLESRFGGLAERIAALRSEGAARAVLLSILGEISRLRR